MQNVYLDINGDIINEIFGLESENKVDKILQDIIGTGNNKKKSSKKVIDLEDVKEKKKKKSSKKKEAKKKRVIGIKRIK